MNILVTGIAGFIGFHLANKLKENHQIIGIDNLNDYYDASLKKSRLKEFGISFAEAIEPNQIPFYKVDILDKLELSRVFTNHKIDFVIHLAAQAGIRYSLINPDSYIKSNIIGFYNILECVKENNVKNLIFASSSSVYGGNKKVPFSEKDNVDNPLNLYAASKKSNELMAYSYSQLYNIKTVGLRFFTVYGPWGRPDMAYYKFTDAISKAKEIDLYNYGKMKRDFTYIGDIVAGIEGIIDNYEKINSNHEIYNIGNNKPVELERFVNILEEKLNKKAKINYLPLQPGDMLETYADISKIQNAFGFSPKTSIEYGLGAFVEWFKNNIKRISLCAE